MATSYKRLEDGTYEVSTDKGPYTIRPELVGIHVLVSNLQRYSSRGKRFLGEAEDFTQSIRGRWKPGHYHFEVISEEGESKVNFPISIEIKSGDPTMSKLVHWGKTDSDSGFIISVELKKEDFDWLWCEIQSRPSARVILQIDVMPFLSGIESHMWYESSYNAIRLERNKPIKIMNTRMNVVDPDLTEPALDDSDEAVPSSMSQSAQLTRLDPSSPWSSRIFYMLLFIALIFMLNYVHVRF